MDAQEDQIPDLSGVAGFYVWCRKNGLNRVKQLAQEPCRVPDTHVEKLCSGSGGGGEDNDASPSPGDVGDDTGASLSFM